MPIKLFHRPAATIILIAVTLSAQQVVRSEESDKTDFDSTPTPVIEFQAFTTAGHYADALAVAARVVDRAADYESGTRALLIEPLMKLATIQKRADDYLAATLAGELAIELIERDGGVFDPALVEPLVFLARLEQDNGNHPAAMMRLNRAQHILHRSDGVMTRLQLPILAYMIRSYAATRQRFKSNQIIEQAYAIIMRYLDENSVEAVPLMIEQAQIKARNLQFKEARKLYYVALGILNQALPENDPGFVDALNGLASVRYEEQLHRGEILSLTGRRATSRTQATEIEVQNSVQFRKFAFFGRRFLRTTPRRIPVPGRKEGTRAQKRVITIIEGHQERYSAIELAEAHIRLGDWFMLIRKPDLSVGPYQAAWQILAGIDDATELLARYFGQPKRLKYRKPKPPQFGPGMYENYDGKYAEVNYTINKNGSVRNLKLGNSNSPAAMNTRLRSAVKLAIFRPRYVDGEAVITENLFFREEFAGMLWWLVSTSEN